MMEDDNFEETTKAFLSWLSGTGVVISPSMVLVDLRSENRGRGAVAVADIMEDEVVFSIPRSSVLNITTGTANLDSTLRDAIATMPPWLALSTIVLDQGSHDGSRWAPYFSILPRELDSLVFWSESELQELQGSTVVKKIGRLNAEELFKNHILPLGIPNASVEMCHRVSSIIMAYAFDIPERIKAEDTENVGEDEDDLVSDDGDDEKTILSMIPLADMLNADAHRNNVRLCCDNENLEMRAIKLITKGEEIFNDYGELPRADLLRRYGYITENYAPYDVAEISTASLLTMVRDSQLLKRLTHQSIRPLNPEDLSKRVELAERENIFEHSYDISLPRPDEESIPDELVALVYLLILEDEHLKAIESSETALPSRSKIATVLVGQILAELFRIREKDYPTSIEDDEDLLRAGNISKRAAMAINVRLGEKRVLKEAILTTATFTGSDRKSRITPIPNMKNQGQKRRIEDQPQPKKKGRHR